MSYQTNDEVEIIINSFKYSQLYEKEKVETVPNAINGANAITEYRILKKVR